MVGFVYFVTLALVYATTVTAFPAYQSLAGLSREELDGAVSSLKLGPVSPPPPPGPLVMNGTKLVDDPAHPFRAPGKSDLRGPCPALNALASHGYINHNGITTPAEMVAAVMEGFNMDHDVAILTTYSAFLVDGNLLTNMVSIGGDTSKTGPKVAGIAPAAEGLNTHGTFEGDSSMTRADAFLGNNHDFNETLFDLFTEYSNKFGAGKYNLTVASELRSRLFQDSIAKNPEFTLVAPRFFTAYNDAVLPNNLFVDGRQDDGQLDMDTARSFFQAGRFPKGFHRAARPTGTTNKVALIADHPIQVGSNVNGVNTYTPDLSTPQVVDDICTQYMYHANHTVRGLYPNPTGPLLEALKINLGYLFLGVKDKGCTQIFPYGK